MPFATFSSPINAELDRVWAYLLHKVEKPWRYLPGVTQSRIVRRTPDGVIRWMRFGDVELTEQVKVDRSSLRIDFELVDHPTYEGTVVNEILPPAADGEPLTLRITLDWRTQDADAAATDMQPMVERAVLRIRDLAEQDADETDPDIG